jgi:outer membrane murein-binding lipoprotein Lpp
MTTHSATSDVSRFARRKLGDFTGIQQRSHDGAGSHNPFKSFAPALMNHLDRDGKQRNLAVYERQSDVAGAGKRDFYRLDQAEIKPKLVNAGIPEERVERFVGDDDKSGSSSEHIRQSLYSLLMDVRAERIGVVAIRDVARLFRDPSQKGPVRFANACARAHVMVLTNKGGQWELLDMNDYGDRNTFIDWCREAATDLLEIIQKTGSAKEISVSFGNYAGGPLPVGYYAKPGLPAHLNGGVATRPTINVYQPHALLKLHVMRMSLLPEIKSLRDLERHLRKHNITFPPFNNDIVHFAFTRSCIHKIKIIEQDGKRRRLGYDESFIPSPVMLENILLHPIALGDRLYGTGPTGKYDLAKLDEIAKREDKPLISFVRIHREFVGTFDHLRLFRRDEEPVTLGNEWMESEELFWKVWEKWGKTDLKTVRQHEYAPEVIETAAENPKRVNKPKQGRPQTFQYRTPWYGKVFCLRHGAENEKPTSFFTMHTFESTRPNGSTDYAWKCYRDYERDCSKGICCLWGNDEVMTRMLDTHLELKLADALSNDTLFLAPIKEAEAERERRINVLSTDLERIEAQIEEIEYELKEWRSRITPANKESIRAKITSLNNGLHPLIEEQAMLVRERDYLRSESADNLTNSTGSKSDLRELVKVSLDKWSQGSVAARRTIIEQFVDWVGVLVGDGIHGHESLVLIKWKRVDVPDILVGWRGSGPDERPWIPEEDDWLRKTWGNKKLSWFQIRKGLQPFRRYTASYFRTRELGIPPIKGSKGCAPRLRQAKVEDKPFFERPENAGTVYQFFDWNISGSQGEAEGSLSIAGQRTVVRRETMDLSVVCERAPLDVQVACGILALRDQHETALSWLAGKHGLNALWSYCAEQIEGELTRVEKADDQETREWLEVILAPQRVANFRRNGVVGCVMQSGLAESARSPKGQSGRSLREGTADGKPPCPCACPNALALSYVRYASHLGELITAARAFPSQRG